MVSKAEVRFLASVKALRERIEAGQFKKPIFSSACSPTTFCAGCPAPSSQNPVTKWVPCPTENSASKILPKVP